MRREIFALIVTFILIFSLILYTVDYYETLNHSHLGVTVNITWNSSNNGSTSFIEFHFCAPARPNTSRTRFVFNNTGKFQGLTLVYVGTNSSNISAAHRVFVTIPYCITNSFRADSVMWNESVYDLTFNGTYPSKYSSPAYIPAPTGYYLLSMLSNNKFSNDSLAYEVPELQSDLLYVGT